MDERRRKVAAFWVAFVGMVLSSSSAFVFFEGAQAWAMYLVGVGFAIAAIYARMLINAHDEFLKEHESLMQMQKGELR
jgi:hypothetical protein